jgi:protein SCO1/2
MGGSCRNMRERIYKLWNAPRCFAAIFAVVLSIGLSGARGEDAQVSASGDQVPLAYRNVGVVEHLNRQLPLDARLYDEDGQYTSLRQILKPNRPLLLQLGYLGCPMLCDTIARSLVDSARKIDLNIGKDFDYVFISIDPTDTPTLATLKRNSYVTEYDRPGSAGGFHILVAQPNEIAEMANAVGFGYKPAQNGQFAHPAVAMVITPEGRISKYLYPPKEGAWFPEQPLRRALADASQEKIGSSEDQILLICLQLVKGTYSFFAMNLMRVGGVMTMMVLGSAIFWMVRRGSPGDRPMDDSGTNGGTN